MRQDRKGELYRRADGLFDWRVVSTDNGDITANSAGQGFTERNDAREAGEREYPDVEFEDAAE